MNSQQREQVRLSLLRYGLGGFTAGLARQHLISEGFSGISIEETKAEVAYLEDKGFLTAASKAISPENRLWKTHANGRDYLATGGIE